MNAPSITTPQSVQKSEGALRGPSRARAKWLIIAAFAAMLVTCTAIVLELSGRVHPASEWVLGERPFGVFDLVLWAMVAAGAVAFFVLLAVCLFTGAWKQAVTLAAMLLIAPFVAVTVARLVAPSSPGTRGFAAWVTSVNTTPVSTWLASNPTGVPALPGAWATSYAKGKSVLSGAASIPVASVPRFDSGRLPDEVLLMPDKSAVFAVYHTGWRASRIVVIGPAAQSIPAQFHSLCTWSIIRDDLVVGEFSRP